MSAPFKRRAGTNTVRISRIRVDANHRIPLIDTIQIHLEIIVALVKQGLCGTKKKQGTTYIHLQSRLDL